MTWNCSKCGDLTPMQVTETEECIKCRWPIAWYDREHKPHHEQVTDIIAFKNEVGKLKQEKRALEVEMSQLNQGLINLRG